MKHEKISIKWRVFTYLLIFTGILLVVLWLIQICYLDSFYTMIKSREAEQVTSVAAGILTSDEEDKDTLISELRVSEARELIGDGFIGGGMLPKLNNCIDAIENGVSRVHILDGRIAHCLLLEIFTNRGIGTAILGDKETKFYHE